jgi:hypothetical protein
VVGAGTFVRQRRSSESLRNQGDSVGITLRRFRCLGCMRWFSVGPADVTVHRHYETSVILAVLLMWSVFGRRGAELRRAAVGPQIVGAHGDARWRSVGRWALALLLGSDTPSLSLAGAALRDWVVQRLQRLLCRFGPLQPPAGFDECVAEMRRALLHPGVASALRRSQSATIGTCHPCTI